MSSKRPELKFPGVLRAGSGILRFSAEDIRKVSVYRLDWDEKERLVKKSSCNWNSDSASSECFEGLPPEYETWLKKLTFVLDRDFLREIRRCFRIAGKEWNRSYSFDSELTEACLKPAVSYISAAVTLLSARVYDPETEYYNEKPDHWIVRHALLYKFWSGQTRTGLVRIYSDFEELLARADSVSQNNWMKDVFSECARFADAVDEWESKKAYYEY